MLALACFIGAPACGGFVESGSGVARITVDERGGTLSIDSFSLTIPPNALQKTVTLTARQAGTDAPVGPAFLVEPSDILFDATHPAEVALAYDAAAHPHASDMFAGMLVAGLLACAFEVKYAADFGPGPMSVSVFGVLHDGLMTEEADRVLGHAIFHALHQHVCEIAFDGRLGRSNPSLFALLDKQARDDGITDGLLGRVAGYAKGDFILAFQMFGHDRNVVVLRQVRVRRVDVGVVPVGAADRAAQLVRHRDQGHAAEVLEKTRRRSSHCTLGQASPNLCTLGGTKSAFSHNASERVSPPPRKILRTRPHSHSETTGRPLETPTPVRTTLPYGPICGGEPTLPPAP